ncbi:hypothetical protein Tco_0270030, partial [Tanacetum coccineum]
LQNLIQESCRVLNLFLRSVRTLDPALKKACIRAAKERVEDLEGRQQALRAEQQELIVLDSPFDLEAFSDSDYAGASLNSKSTTGGCQFLGKRLISWQCKKQTIVANSTTEAEYVAAANCCG